MKRITIDPITRLEAMVRLKSFWMMKEESAMHISSPRAQGFEKFCEGRPVEELPAIPRNMRRLSGLSSYGIG